MKDVMGVINLTSEQESLKELNNLRCNASVPFGGRYRLIDFTLSNMVNSGINDVAIFPLNKYRSLMDHLGTGKDWDLDRKKGGLFLLPPYLDEQTGSFKGELSNIYYHLDFFERGDQKHVIISNGTLVANIDYREAFISHKKVDSDITLFFREGQHMLDTFIIKKDVLVKLVKENIEKDNLITLNQVIELNINKLKINSFTYDGLLAKINSIDSYYKLNMMLLKPSNWKKLFLTPNHIFTKVKDEPPTNYKEGSEVKNTLIANGCIIEGKVENSIIFRGVKIGKGAYIKDSIIMQKCVIGEGVKIEKAVLDKEVTVRDGKAIYSKDNSPVIIAKRMTI